MRQLQPVLWTKGVLLSPQHLQVQERFLEDTLDFYVSSLTVAPWGFHHLEIDREALSTGVLSLRNAAGIFPDGLLFDFPRSDSPPAPVQLRNAFTADQPSLDVFLAIPEYQHNGHNVSGSRDDGQTRFRAQDLLLRDETTGMSERPIQVAQKNLRLLLGGESLKGYSVLRAARVIRTPVGGFELSTGFLPPLIDFRGSQALLTMARGLVEILGAKSTELASTRRQKNLSLADFGHADVGSFWLLYTVNSHFATIRHLYESRGGHPALLFEAMLALASALTTFSQTTHPRNLPRYDQGDLTTSFERLDSMLRKLLESVVPATTVSLPMRLVKPSLYATALDQKRYFDAQQIYLAFTAEGRSLDFATRVPQLVKVSAEGQLDHLVRHALPGVPLTFAPSPPMGVPVRMNHVYFTVNRLGSEWEAITRAGNLAAYVPGDFASPQLELVIVLPKE